MLGLQGYTSSGSSSDDNGGHDKENSAASGLPLESKEKPKGAEETRPLLNDHEDIPKEPSAPCSSEVQKLFQSYFKIKNEKGIKFVDKLHANSEFDNPALLDLKIWQLDIHENCTNFSPESWDPLTLEKVKVDVERFIPVKAHEAIVERKRKKASRLEDEDADKNRGRKVSKSQNCTRNRASKSSEVKTM